MAELRISSCRRPHLIWLEQGDAGPHEACVPTANGLDRPAELWGFAEVGSNLVQEGRYQGQIRS
jgi:hypothetical protein